MKIFLAYIPLQISDHVYLKQYLVIPINCRRPGSTILSKFMDEYLIGGYRVPFL